jgi:type VI secretion system protein ImpB
VQIDRDNFDEVMRRMTPGLELRVENTLQNDGSELAVSLKFEKLEDFEPAAVVEQVPALKTLLEARSQLRDLLAKADRSEELETLLENILQNKTDLAALRDELGSRKGEPDQVATDAEQKG